MPRTRVATRSAGMTRAQADVCLYEAFALGWEAAVAECLRGKRYKVILKRAEGDLTLHRTAWTWADWRAIAREEAERELPF